MKNRFEKNKYIVVKNVISEELSDFAYKYFLLKRQVAETFFSSKYISPFEEMYGVWNDPQVPNTYSNYADMVMEVLLVKLLPLMEKVTKLKLNPNYSYARIYKKGDVLNRHKDRFSCEISTTLNLGGDVWSIYLDPTGKENNKGVKINLNPGDMLIYKGNEIEHWREPFDGEICTQVFLHYNNITTEGSKDNIFDKRPHLGLPAYFKK